MTPAPASEWVAGGIGLALVLGAVAFTVWEGATQSRRPPDFTIRVDGVEPRNGRHRVLFTVRNAGDTTAAQVTIRATVSRDGMVLERAEATFDYIAAGATRRGGFVLGPDPSAQTLEIGAVSWTIP